MDKKAECKRLVVFLVTAFGMSWIIFFAYLFSGRTWGQDGEISSMDQFISLGMLCPAVAMLFTRYVTKEGFAVTGKDSMLLGIYFRNGKWICFLVAMLLPWFYFEIGNGLRILFAPEAFDVNNPSLLGISETERGIVFLQPVAAIISGTIASFAAFGEEAGWRGYMMPKMMKLWGMKKAVIVGGILWGVWHWPLTFAGHNFGRNYWGYPFSGFAAMCVMCIFIGIILTYLTYRSGSIWPATILHAVNNSTPSIIQYYINPDKITGWTSDSVASFMIMVLPMMVIALGVYVKFSRECKKNFKTGKSKEARG